MGYKNTYEEGDYVSTPLGDGTILSVRTSEKQEGTVLFKVKHDDFKDHDGDTFEFESTQLNHSEKANKSEQCIWVAFNRSGSICSTSTEKPVATEDAFGHPWIKYASQ